ncbi:MAG: 3-oxoacyl-ACP reductase [Nisaea sp.]|jgi:NAD(P)-dependent dehydrogenase (short-subunit alcohol dehydrogenase family)|nr:3-oxoacyl-ACP reductase [Nisaea sp.]OUX93189.1 MAG: 3-oxoacyl-ACP reductase [Candidatus Endolissoclinum sp. TMED26]
MEARETPHVAGRLAGKVAIIGGAGSIGPGWGNGKASATLMARAGAAVVAVDRDPDAAAQTVEIIRAEGGQAIAVEGDLSRSETAQKLVAETLSAFGRIDILHNNVGIVRTGGLVDTDEETWDMVHAVNLKSAYLTSQAVAPEMLKNGGGSMIHTASIAGIRHIGVDYLSYSTTKGALLPFSRSIALEYAGRGIRSNCILPGLMNTPMIRVGLPDAYADGDAEEMVRLRDAQCPMGHMGNAWDVAFAALFLGSDESRYITGTEIIVDGGITAKFG